MLTPKGRGALSEALFEAMRTGDVPESITELPPTDEDDAQIALWALYEQHYRGFDDVGEELEWHPGLIAVRGRIEVAFEQRLRDRHSPVELAEPFAESFFAYVEGHDGRSLAGFIQRDATPEQVLEVLRLRSIYQLKEADPSTWAIPRLPRAAKAALVELQYDEYGGGDPARLHAELFARGMEAAGLRSEYGAYIDDVPVEVLELNNAMSMFGLHRRLRGAAMGHLAAFEIASSVPSRRTAQGLERVGLPPEMIRYYDEHVEADAVHEQVAVRAICGALLRDEPLLVGDVVFGAFTCLDLEDRLAGRLLDAWAHG